MLAEGVGRPPSRASLGLQAAVQVHAVACFPGHVKSDCARFPMSSLASAREALPELESCLSLVPPFDLDTGLSRTVGAVRGVRSAG